jgi:hypothetical protein
MASKKTTKTNKKASKKKAKPKPISNVGGGQGGILGAYGGTVGRG